MRETTLYNLMINAVRFKKCWRHTFYFTPMHHRRSFYWSKIHSRFCVLYCFYGLKRNLNRLLFYRLVLVQIVFIVFMLYHNIFKCTVCNQCTIFRNQHEHIFSIMKPTSNLKCSYQPNINDAENNYLHYR